MRFTHAIFTKASFTATHQTACKAALATSLGVSANKITLIIKDARRLRHRRNRQRALSAGRTLSTGGVKVTYRVVGLTATMSVEEMFADKEIFRTKVSASVDRDLQKMVPRLDSCVCSFCLY